MENNDRVPDARSGVHHLNIQEVIDAAVSDVHALQGGQQQYQTPEWLARGCAALLPFGHHASVLDPQCASGALLKAVSASLKYGAELDRRLEDSSSKEIHRITGNCVDIFATMDELFNDTRFACIVANPPFAIRWKVGEATMDSTQWTWNLIKQRLAEHGSGFLISNANTLEQLRIVEDPWVYSYQRFPGGRIWENCNVELGIVHFCHRRSQSTAKRCKEWDHVPDERELVQYAKEFQFHYHYRPYTFGAQENNWMLLTKIVREESGDRQKWNISIREDEMLRTYLSTRAQFKINKDEILRLSRINNCHPLTLTTERETRKLMHEYITSGRYTIQPEAKAAIQAALAQVASLACPIRNVTEFEHVAYAGEEEEHLKCKSQHEGSGRERRIKLSIGKFYEIRTGTYTFEELYSKKKIYFDEETGKTEIEDHDYRSTGEDRYIELTDDSGALHRFMDRPRPEHSFEHAEELVWQLFEKPFVPTVAEVQREDYEKNLSAMKFNELLAGFTYYTGQLDYYARMACKNYGLVAADVGTGKSLGALTLIALKCPQRTLLIAPQGTMRSVGDEEEVDYEASQWVKEIQRFAPTEPVFQLFSKEDWQHILYANGGKLPNGIYITYPQAYYSNDGFEHLPESWEGEEEKRFCTRYSLPYDKERGLDQCFHRNIGAAGKGIRCIAEASLATCIAQVHGEWDMVILDEAHLYCNPKSRITKNMLRLQPKYRFAMTATPIPNIVSNIFPLMGWLCVPDWYKGEKRNAAWPYAVDEDGRFNSTFLSIEVDLTAQEKAKAAGKKGWGRIGVRTSPRISSPARLLKLLKPTMAYISKEDCNPNLQPCEVIDVRVATGKEQTKLYGHWLNRANYLNEFSSPLTIARVQSTRLRGICAAPASLDYTGGMCLSNFNPKMVTILELIRDCLKRGEQVVVVSARVGQSTALAGRLADSNIQIARIDSTVKAELHTAEANRFKRGDARVMLMGIKCAQGHSFEQCPNLIIGSLEWSYGTLHQAKGRVWRLNSPRPVKIWCVLHKNTIEELLFDRVALKQDAATLCLHGKRVPRDFQTLDADEILAEHVVNYDAGAGVVLSESECESQWDALRQQLVMANVTLVKAAA